MDTPANYKYTDTHEWVKVEGTKTYIGITDHAQHAMGDVVFIDLPQKGKVIKAGDSLGVVESVKAVSDIYSPLSGKIIDVNEVLTDSPEKINEDPYESWITAIEISDDKELEKLLSKERYEELCMEES